MRLPAMAGHVLSGGQHLYIEKGRMRWPKRRKHTMKMEEKRDSVSAEVV